MKLTPKQNELIEEYQRLESKYGKGNVFLRYVKEQLNIKEIERKVWDHAREICMDLADETADDVN